MSGERLKGLIEHWIEHNEEHRVRLLEEAEEAEKLGLKNVSERLRKAAESLGEASKWLREALKAFEQ